MHVSIILPTYNRANMIKHAIDSVTDQLRPGDELIVIDDGSTDETEQVVPRSDYVRYIRTENQGAGAARNRGIEEARGQLIGFVDSDNFWLPSKLEQQRKLMLANQNVVCCFMNWISTKSDGETHDNGIQFWTRGDAWWEEALATCEASKFELRSWIGDMFPILAGGNYIPVWTALIRSSCLESDDRFPSDVHTHEEWEFFGKVTQKGLTAFIDKPGAHNLAHDGPRLTDIGYAGRLETELLILERVWGNNSEFLQNHPDRMRTVCQRRLVPLVRSLIRQEKYDEAKEAIRRCPTPNLPMKFLSRCPTGILAILRLIRMAVEK